MGRSGSGADHATTMSSIFANVDRMSTGAKLLVVVIGLLLMLAHSLNNQKPTQPYRTQTSTPPWLPQERPPHVTLTPVLPTPAPFPAETPFFPPQTPTVGPTVEVRRALPPDVSRSLVPSVGPTVEVRRALPLDVKLPTPNSTAQPPALSHPLPSPQTTRTPTPDYNDAKWPDDRMLIHPENFVRSQVANVRPNDKLALRSGPGTRFTSLTEIPHNGTDILVFDKDVIQDPDGKTSWYPVEWQGFRGYVSGGYLAHSQ
jgi:hypothetical protein